MCLRGFCTLVLHCHLFLPQLVSCFVITEAINYAAEAWGLRCLRYEIKDIQLPTKVRDAMQMQVIL